MMKRAAVQPSVVRSATLMVTLRVIFRLIGLVSTLVLARLLTPDAFGVVAAASAVFAVMQLLTDFSFTAALVRTANIRREHYDTAWTLGLIRGLTLAAAMVLGAGGFAALMNEPRLEPTLAVMAVTLVIQSLENPRFVDLHREMRFDRVFRYQLAGKIIHFTFTVTLAFMLRNYWALIYSSLLLRTVMLPVSYWYVPYRPALSLRAIRELFDFSKWVLITNGLSMVDGYVTTFFLSRILGSATVGLYQVSYQIGSLPASEVAAPIRDPMYAGWARLLGNPQAVGRSFIDGFSFLFMIITPMSLGLVSIADLVTPLLLGDKWDGAATLVGIIAVYAHLDACGHFTHNLYVVLGRQRRFVLVYVAVLFLRVPAVGYGVITAGAMGAAYAMAITAAINAAVWIVCAMALIEFPISALLRNIWRVAISSMLMMLVVVSLRPMWVIQNTPGLLLAQATCFSIVGAGVYVACQILLWLACGSPPGPEDRAMQMLRSAAGKVLPRGSIRYAAKQR